MNLDAWVILLRGVNVGGNNILPMKDFAALVEQCGGASVRTYIQSGNAVMRSPAAVAKGMAAKLEAAIAAQHGFQAPVVMRSAEELRAVLRDNPLSRSGVPEDAQLILFLKEHPSAEAAAQLDPERWRPDTFLLQGREIYAHYPLGLGKSKMTNAYFDSRLKTICTGRNLRTLAKLLEMTEA